MLNAQHSWINFYSNHLRIIIASNLSFIPNRIDLSRNRLDLIKLKTQKKLGYVRQNANRFFNSKALVHILLLFCTSINRIMFVAMLSDMCR